jgi:outer membrane lipoprotein-sorting protein
MAWAAPVVVAGAVAAGVMLSSASSSDASPSLPTRTAAQLLTALQKSDVTALSGQVKETANLGIPSLPGEHSSASFSWQTFITGSHSAKVWVDGADKQRVALVGELSEADVVHNGKDVWTYTSDTNTVTHSVLPAEKNGKHDASEPASAKDATPAGIAARVLKAIDPTTKVTVDSTRVVAGRDAYTLTISPRDSRSTVHKVTIAIDAKKYVPLQVQIYGSGSSPAFQTGFTDISFTTPAASTFKFHTPKGATVSNDPFGTKDVPGEHHHGDRRQADNVKPQGKPAATDPGTTSKSPKVIGKGWTTIVELPAGMAGAQVLNNGTLHDLTSSVGSSGARLLHTALINAVLLPDGRTFIGAVSPALLEHVAATTPN